MPKYNIHLGFEATTDGWCTLDAETPEQALERVRKGWNKGRWDEDHVDVHMDEDAPDITCLIVVSVEDEDGRDVLLDWDLEAERETARMKAREDAYAVSRTQADNVLAVMEAARTMQSALRIMSCAANWAAHEAAMVDVRAALAQAEAAGVDGTQPVPKGWDEVET